MHSTDLHIRTLLYVISLGSLLLAIGLVLVRRVVKREPVLDEWIAGSVLLAIGYGLMPLRDPESSGWWMAAANFVVLSGYGRYFQGVRRFVGLPTVPGAEAALLAVTALALVQTAVLAPNLPAQIIVVSVASAAMAWANAWTLWRGPWRIRDELRRVAAGLAAAWGAIYAVRALAALKWHPDGRFLDVGGPLHGATEVLIFGMQCWLNVLLPLLIVARMHEHRLDGERRLRVREEQLRIFIQHAPAAIAMFDRHMNYLAASSRWLANYRLSGVDVVGRNHYEIFPEMPAHWREAHRRALDGAVERGERDHFQRADGSSDWVRWELRPWHEADGRIGGVLLFSEIISEQVELMAALQRYREHLEELAAERTAQIERQNAEIADLYHRAPCGYHSLDPAGTIVSINDTELAMLGYTREEIVGRRNIRDILAPDSLAAFEERFARLQRLGEMRDEELDFLRKDGSVLPVIVGTNAVCAPDGTFLYSRTVVVDNTERRRADEAVRATTAQLALALKVTRLVVFHQGVDLRYSWIANPAFDLTAETVLGRRDEDLFAPESAAELTAFKRGVLASGQPGRHEFRVWRCGRMECFDLLAEPTRDAAGNLTGLMCASADVTERKHMEEALLSSNVELEARVLERTRELRELTVDTALAEERERQAIARDLHDDLGQLLHVAKIKLDTLARMVVDNRTRLLAREVDDLVGDASARVRSLTAQLCPPVLENLGLIPALGWLAEEMERAYGLVVEVEDDGLPKPVTPAQAIIVFRAARELLINVFKHAKSPYAVVETRYDDGELELRVTDEGAGIDDPEAAAGGERGFGLASVRERIGYLNGSMRVESAPGEGTRVVLRLPLAMVHDFPREDVA
ncbi:MAG: PAS domain S-box protein [Gammaproteobacteria bacterium]|nr:PAS domain S-box protein [Gammaproteobacteria bacterium]MBI5616006.1 PAS domain S-box protein [Gammaproteobacteria bacterium]